MKNHFVVLILCLLLGTSCTMIKYSGFPDVEFDQAQTAPETENIRLARGQSGDGSEALRYSVTARSCDQFASPGTMPRLWAQCVNGEMQVLLDVGRKIDDHRGSRHLLRYNVQGLNPMTGLEATVRVTKYSASLVFVELPVAFLRSLEGASLLEVEFLIDEQLFIKAVFEPVVNQDFLGQVTDLCPAAWQAEERDKENLPEEASLKYGGLPLPQGQGRAVNPR